MRRNEIKGQSQVSCFLLEFLLTLIRLGKGHLAHPPAPLPTLWFLFLSTQKCHNIKDIEILNKFCKQNQGFKKNMKKSTQLFFKPP